MVMVHLRGVSQWQPLLRGKESTEGHFQARRVSTKIRRCCRFALQKVFPKSRFSSPGEVFFHRLALKQVNRLSRAKIQAGRERLEGRVPYLSRARSIRSVSMTLNDDPARE